MPAVAQTQLTVNWRNLKGMGTDPTAAPCGDPTHTVCRRILLQVRNVARGEAETDVRVLRNLQCWFFRHEAVAPYFVPTSLRGVVQDHHSLRVFDAFLTDLGFVLNEPACSHGAPLTKKLRQ